MTTGKQERCAEILSDVKSLMDTVDAARLTSGQFDQINRLKTELSSLCDAGDVDRALRTKDLIVSIIKEGPPVYG